MRHLNRVRPLAAAALAVGAPGVLGHPVAAAQAGAVALPWSLEPWVIACLGLSGLLYAIGALRLRRRAKAGRGVAARHAWAFSAGWLALVVALVSPLDPLGERLFSAHMVQHEMLMIVAAPLLVLGRPLAAWAWALPRQALGMLAGALRAGAWRTFWHGLTRPLSAWSLHAIALWGWHLPAAFEAALARPGVHVAQHLSFFATALLFWWTTIAAASRRDQGYALASLFTTMAHTAALGALMSLSPMLWYPSYALSSAALGMDPLEDQQLGGLVMWIPAGAAYLAGGLWIASRWLRSPRAGGARPAAVHRLPSAIAPSPSDHP